LFEGAAGIDFVEFSTHAGIGSVFAKNRAAFVGGAVVEQDQFEILERLPQDSVEALAQVPCVVVIRNDDANGGHVHPAFHFGTSVSIGI